MSFISRSYLLCYNSLLVCGWFSIFVHCVSAAWRAFEIGSLTPFTKIYAACEWNLLVFQSLAVLEILHAAIGIVKSSPVLTGCQVFSRVFITWGIAYSVRQVQSHYSVPMFIFAWSTTEIIRYSWYAFSLFSAAPYILTWLRYTLFIVAYPIGVVGELWAVFFSLSFASTLFRLALPNPYNISFYYPYFMIFFMVMYIPVFPQLYLHMFAQRRKTLGGKTTADHAHHE